MSFTRIDLVKLTRELIDMYSPYEEELEKANDKIHELEEKVVKRIAVVEANETFRHFTVNLLLPVGSGILEFSSGKQFVAYYNKFYNLINILYINIEPEGEEAIKFVRSFERVKSLTPIQIVVFVPRSFAAKQYLFDIGADKVLVKSIQSNENSSTSA